VKVMVVDDDHFNRQYLSDFLTKLGHTVFEAREGTHAMELFVTEPVDLVLSDIRMPGCTGTELLHQIRSMPGKSDTLVVLFTAYSDVSTAVEALRAGAYHYLIKPINVRELDSLIEQVGELLSFRRENQVLTSHFEEAVQAATQETREELHRFKRAFYESVGINDIGMFSPVMREVYQQARLLHGDRSIPVLIQGETGTGKELVARYIHYGEGVSTPFVDINCAALNPSIFESELFGYEAGAFSGASSKGQKGKIDLAKGGTLFLDEISEIPVHLQAKLLRVVQERDYFRVGGLKKIQSDIRLVCASNADLENAVAEGAFRSDLYYRLNTGIIKIPPLREHTEDIVPLASMFLKHFSHDKKKHFEGISPEATQILLNYQWPGNVRELKNLMERAVLMWDDQELKPIHIAQLAPPEKVSPGVLNQLHPALDNNSLDLPPDGLPLESFIEEIIQKALKMHDGNVTKTARYLGISRRSLSYRLNHH